MGMVEPLPRVIEEKGEEVQFDSIVLELDMWLEAPESKIQSIHEVP